MTSFGMVEATGLEPADYQEKYSRLARLERIAILLIFLFLRLPSSATGGGRLRNLLPKLLCEL